MSREITFHRYKCASTSPPFFGCCASDPCQNNRCPHKDLRAAVLAPDRAEATPFGPLASSTTPAIMVKVPETSSLVETSAERTATTLGISARRVTTRSETAATIVMTMFSQPKMTGSGQEMSSSNNIMAAGVGVSSAALVLMIIGGLLGFRWSRKKQNKLRKDREKHYPSPPASERVFLRRVLDTNNHEEITNPAQCTDVVPADRAGHHAPRSPQAIRQLDSTDVPARQQLASRSTYELPSSIIDSYFEHPP